MKTLKEYLNQDAKIIGESNFTESELKRLRVSSYLHQLTLASVWAPLLLVSATGFANRFYEAGVEYGAMALPLWGIYLRYGFRANTVSKKLKIVVNSEKEKSTL